MHNARRNLHLRQAAMILVNGAVMVMLLLSVFLIFARLFGF